MFTISTEQFPYSNLAHWPPLTYRNNSVSPLELRGEFIDYLNAENTSKDSKELQPWIPFCEGKCAFCYFPVHCERQIYSTYLIALKKALRLYSETKYVKSSDFGELYVGGGSPSVLSEEQITDLLDFCNSTFNLTKDCQIKFTACTSSLTENKIRVLSSYNVNQLDVGIQTFNTRLRGFLALKDTAEEAKLKVKTIKRAGLGVSIDLLYNLPGQSLDEWEKDLNQALELDVESVDCYPLDLYANTPLARKIASGEIDKPGDYRMELQMYLKAYQLFKENGYFPTCHNRFSRLKKDFEKPASEVIGSGAGFFMGTVGPFQYCDIENISEYIKSAENNVFPLANLSKLSTDDEMKKSMMMLYVRVPVNREEFKLKFGVYPEYAFPDAVNNLINKGLIKQENGELKLTEKGDPWRFNIAWEFFKNLEENK